MGVGGCGEQPRMDFIVLKRRLSESLPFGDEGAGCVSLLAQAWKKDHATWRKQHEVARWSSECFPRYHHRHRRWYGNHILMPHR